MHRLVCLIVAVAFTGALLSSAEAPAAVTYYFHWYCTGCSALGSGSNGREGPFGSPSACEASRALMGGSLSMRGCGPGCFYPQVCQSDGAPDVPPALRQFPAYPPPLIQSPPASSYGAGDGRRAAEARREREEAEREAQARGGGDTPSGTRPDLSARWRNAYSRYEVRKSAQAIEILLVETCMTADCNRKAHPNRLVFRGRLEDGLLIGVVLIHAAVESWQDSAHCATPAGEFPIQGKLSGDGQWIKWGKAELLAQKGLAACAG